MAAIASAVAFAGAAFLMWKGVGGWGWLIFAGIVAFPYNYGRGS